MRNRNIHGRTVINQVTLREYKETDIDRIIELANNKNVSRYLVDTFPYPYTEKDAIWWISLGHKLNDSTNFIIEVDNDLVGGIGVTPGQGWKSHTAEIGYWIGEPYWNRGIATSALSKMTDHAFTVLGFKKLSAPVLMPNKASMRVLEKCGYELEGVLKLDIFKDNEFHDIHYYAKLPE